MKREALGVAQLPNYMQAIKPPQQFRMLTTSVASRKIIAAKRSIFAYSLLELRKSPKETAKQSNLPLILNCPELL